MRSQRAHFYPQLWRSDGTPLWIDANVCKYILFRQLLVRPSDASRVGFLARMADKLDCADSDIPSDRAHRRALSVLLSHSGTVFAATARSERGLRVVYHKGDFP